jgi:hypothetical protein
MGDSLSPLFTMKYFFHPLTLINLLICGFLGMVQLAHTHAHYKMDIDVDSYVHSFLKKNPDYCK